MSEINRGRVEETIRYLVAEALLRKVKDPRVSAVSIISVKVSRDYSFAKIMYNVIGGEGDLDDVRRGLDSCKGFIRGLLKGKLRTRVIPELAFVYDESLDRAMKIENIIEKLHDEEAEAESGGDDEE